VLAVLVVVGAVAAAWWSLNPGAIREPIRVLAAARSAIMGGATPEATAGMAPSAPSTEADTGLVEVCGLGWVEKKSDADPVDSSLLAEIPGIQAARGALIERLRRSPDALARAAAIAAALNSGAGPGDDAPLIESLAREASTIADPRVYSLALHLCSRTPTSGSCALLSAAQWARLDPGNGAPWLSAMDEAATRDDRALFDEALYRLASASRLDDRSYAAAGVIVAEAGLSDSDLMAARELALNVRGRIDPMPSLQRLAKACQGAELIDANRGQICDAAATTLTERSDSITLAQIGALMGRRLGWPPDRIIAVDALLFSLRDSWSSVADAQTPLGESHSCNGVRDTLARLGQLARVGEVQAARDWMISSGKGFEAFASLARDEENRRRAAVAAEDASRRVAASAASASGAGG